MKNNEDQAIIRLTQFRDSMTNIIVRKVPSLLQSTVLELFDLVLNEFGYKAFDWIKKQEEIRKELEWRIEQLQKAAQASNKSSLPETQQNIKKSDDILRENLQQTFEKDQKPSQVEKSKLSLPNNSDIDSNIGPANSKDHSGFGKQQSVYVKKQSIKIEQFSNVLDPDEINRSSSRNKIADSSKEIHQKLTQLSYQSNKSEDNYQKDQYTSKALKNLKQAEEQILEEQIKRSTRKEQNYIEQKDHYQASHFKKTINKSQIQLNEKSSLRDNSFTINKKQEAKMESQRSFAQNYERLQQNQQAFFKFVDISSIYLEKISSMEEMEMNRKISLVSACSSKFNTPGNKLWHAAIHIVVDGNTQVWQYGRFDGTDGILKKRNGGKYASQKIITSCRMSNQSYGRFINCSRDYCADKKWAVKQGDLTTNCQWYAYKIIKQFTIPTCVQVMKNQITKNWIQPARLLGDEVVNNLVPPSQ